MQFGLWINLDDAMAVLKALRGEDLTLEEHERISTLRQRIYEHEARRQKMQIVRRIEK